MPSPIVLTASVPRRKGSLLCSSSQTGMRRRRSIAVASLLHWFASSASQCSSFFTTNTSRRPHVQPINYQITDQETTTQPQVTSWLYGHLSETNILKLKTALQKSHASSDTSRTLDAIRAAAGGDMNKMAGAAKFCHILVDVMEMGQQTDALIAAAYHYCSCVTARESSEAGSFEKKISTEIDDEFQKVYIQPLSGAMMGHQAETIAMDAAKLKRVETTASSLLHSPKEADVHRRLILSTSGDWRALAIRSAACLFRLLGVQSRHQHDYARPKLSRTDIRICREALHVYSPLASRMGMHRLKHKLDDKAFRLLYPRQHARASSIMHQRSKHGQKTRKLLDDITLQVKQMLDQDPIFSKYSSSVLVCGRTKEPLSLWKKMLKENSSLGKNKQAHIPADTLALRIVLEARKMSPNEALEITKAREKELCYYVQRLCLKQWKPYSADLRANEEAGRFKDYIQYPKPNGYQSLHFTATASKEPQFPFEIQIRSMVMHHVAEYGLAAHFDYKVDAKRTPTNSEQKKDRNFDNRRSNSEADTSAVHLEEEQGNVMSLYLEALSTAKNSLTRNVFVFLAPSNILHTPKIVSLRAGSCMVDAMQFLEGERLFGAPIRWRRNQDMIGREMTRRLKNGDVLAV